MGKKICNSRGEYIGIIEEDGSVYSPQNYCLGKFDSYGVFYSLSGIKIGTVDSQRILCYTNKTMNLHRNSERVTKAFSVFNNCSGIFRMPGLFYF